jgi:hypothetical protein
VLHPVAHLSNWFLVIPSIATKFQYVNSFLFSFSLTTCFGPYRPSSGEIYNWMLQWIISNCISHLRMATMRGRNMLCKLMQYRVNTEYCVAYGGFNLLCGYTRNRMLNPTIKIGMIRLKKTKTKLHGLSPRANYTDRATVACRRSDCQLLRIEGATWSAWRIPTAVFSVL